MAGMMLQMAGMGAGMSQMSEMMPQMVSMSSGTTGTLPQMMPGMMSQMSGIMQGQPGDNVYRPIIDFLTGSSQTGTLMESQFIATETFSLEELGLSPVRVSETQSPPAVGRGVVRRRRAGARTGARG